MYIPECSFGVTVDGLEGVDSCEAKIDIKAED